MNPTTKKIFCAFITIIAIFTFAKSVKAITVYPAIFEFNTTRDAKLADTMQVYNESNTAITIAADIENFISKGESGEQNFIPGNNGLASWISLSQKEISLNPGEKKSVSFKINLPQTPVPGAYSAGILWHEVNKTGKAVSIINRVGALVLLTIAGDSEVKAELVEFGVDKSFFEKLPVNFAVRIANKGNTLIKPAGEIVIKNIFGRTVDALEINSFGNALLPESIRRFEAKWDSTSLALGRYTATLRVKYGGENELNADIEFWVVPWKQIAVGIAGLLLLAIIYAKTLGKIRRARRNRI
jgi:hypothetical protein